MSNDELMAIINEKLESNQKKLELNLKGEVTKEVKAKSKELKTSIANYLSTEITSIKSLVTTRLDEMDSIISSSRTQAKKKGI